jgi:O-antigen/teichoic acid export membrane protein
MMTWRRNRDLLGNASSLAATTGLTSALGFAYWAFAARLFSQRAVGYGSATVSAMTMLGTIGMLGLGTVLIGELPRRRPRAGLISAALLASAGGSLALGLGFAVIAPHVSARFRDMSSTPAQAALFAAGVALTGMTLVFDQATIGLMRGGLQLSRNLAFSLVKLLLLPGVALALHDQLGIGITLSWVAGTAASLLPTAVQIRLAGGPVFARPDWGVLRGLGRTALAHNWLNLAIAVPRSLIPVLVTVVVSPSANAAFYAAWMLSSFLYVVPTHLATVLFAIASADPQQVARKLRFTLRMSAMIGLPGMAVLGFGAHLALSMFGASYARVATLPLWLLAAGYVPMVPMVHYIAVCRAAGRVPRAAAVLSATAVLEIAAAAAGGTVAGLKGLSVALLGAFICEGLVTAPAVIRAAVGGGRHRRAAAATWPARHPDPGALSGAGAAGRAASHGPAPRRGSYPAGAVPSPGLAQAAHAAKAASRYERQQEGLAALLAIARSAGIEPQYHAPPGYESLPGSGLGAGPPGRQHR